MFGFSVRHNSQLCASLVACWLIALSGLLTTQTWAARSDPQVSRMVFKQNTKNKREPSCQLTLMHVYTGKFNKKNVQFVFTGAVMAKRSKDTPLAVSVVGQNHLLGHSGQDYKVFPIARLEMGVDDASVRRFALTKSSCKKGFVCVDYRDNKKKELQALLEDSSKNMHLFFPLAAKQTPLVVDLSKFLPTGKDTTPPLGQFKNCMASLR
jgi:hypothetical protein